MCRLWWRLHDGTACSVRVGSVWSGLCLCVSHHVDCGVMYNMDGDVAQMVERPLSMREVQGSIPCFSTFSRFASTLVSHTPHTIL